MTLCVSREISYKPETEIAMSILAKRLKCTCICFCLSFSVKVPYAVHVPVAVPKPGMSRTYVNTTELKFAVYVLDLNWLPDNGNGGFFKLCKFPEGI